MMQLDFAADVQATLSHRLQTELPALHGIYDDLAALTRDTIAHQEHARTEQSHVTTQMQAFHQAHMTAMQALQHVYNSAPVFQQADAMHDHAEDEGEEEETPVLTRTDHDVADN